jgi:hypothetical protein
MSTTLDERTEAVREQLDHQEETSGAQALEAAAEGKQTPLFELPKPDLTLLKTVAEGFDPEELHVSFGGTVKLSSHADRAVAFVNGCKPGRRQRIVLDTFVTKGGVPQAKENADGDIIHTLAVALKVEGIDLDTDPWDATELKTLRRYAASLVRDHRAGDDLTGHLDLLGEFLESKGVQLEPDDEDTEDDDETPAAAEAETTDEPTDSTE